MKRNLVEKTKNPVGRPTVYNPDYCAIVIAMLNEGASKYEIGHALGHSQQTLAEWAEKFEDFGEALKNGKDLSRGWWEAEGRKSLRDKEFNCALWYMNMKNRFGYTDKQDHTMDIKVRQEDILKGLE